jgi:hypothetical protein
VGEDKEKARFYINHSILSEWQFTGGLTMQDGYSTPPPPTLHCKEDPIYVFLEMKLSGLVPNFLIHVSVSIEQFIYSHDQSTYFAAAK